MRALITGGAGFVGRTLAAHLRDRGDEVVITDRAAGGPDITDRAAVFSHMAAADPEVVFHLAAQAHVPTSWKDPIGTFRANAEGTLNVLDAARESGVTRVLAVTSAEVYGRVDPDDLPIDETRPLRPETPYAASKVAADAIAQQAHLGCDQDVIRIRAFNHFGPGQSAQFVAAGLATRIIEAERSGQRELRVGNLTPRRDFTDVRDIVRAYRLLADGGEAGEVYNVCSGVDLSIQEVADGLLLAAGADLELVPDPELQRPVDVPVVRGSNRRLRDATGWQPTIPLADSLADIVADARARADA